LSEQKRIGAKGKSLIKLGRRYAPISADR